MSGEILQEVEAIYNGTLVDDVGDPSDRQLRRARDVISEALLYVAPPPDLSTSTWADENVYLPSEITAAPGPWRTDRRPWLRGIMDAADDPLVTTITVEKASRMGITMAILNIFGKRMAHDPCAIFYVQQTLGEGQKFSRKILTPFIENTPAIRELIPQARTRKAGNTILEKSFPGGALTIVGANVPTGFRMIYAKIAVCDDVDGFEWSVGKEGDPVELALGRIRDSWDRKFIIASKPTVKGFSRVDQSFERSNKQFYYVPCPHCDTFQVLRFGGKDLDFGIKWTHGDPSSAYYLCESCHAVIYDYHKMQMVVRGEWRATAVSPGHAGFGGLSHIYHPDMAWSELVADFDKSTEDPEKLQVFINDRLGEVWEDRTEGMDEGSLMIRREDYGPDLREEVCVLTAAVDVQENYLAIGVEGWARGEENFLVEYTLLAGDTLLPDVWEALDGFLLRSWRHPSGIDLRIKAVAIDSGFRDEVVSSFVRGRLRTSRNIIAIKGDEKTKSGKIISDLPAKRNKYKVHVYIVNATRAKTSIFGRLKISKPGPAFLHFPMEVDEEYFKGLLSERWVTVRQDGILKRKLMKRQGARNEPLDVKGYNLAVLEWLKMHRRFDLDRLADSMVARMKRKQEEEALVQVQDPRPTVPVPTSSTVARQIPKIKKTGWIKGWK